MILESPISAALYAIYQAAPTKEEALLDKHSRPHCGKDPDPDEIEDHCRAIREGWSDHDLEARQVSLGSTNMRRVAQFWLSIREREFVGL